MKASKQLPSRKAMVYNGAAIAIGVSSLLFALQSSLVTTHVERCSPRYTYGIRMGVERGGQPLTPEDLQSRLAGTDWGLLERSKVVKIKSGPAPFALQMDLKGAKADDHNDANGREGIGFVWTPSKLGSVASACLSYSVFLPDSFDFGGGGRLPGLIASSRGERGDPSRASDQQPPLTSQFVWNDAGQAEVYLKIPNAEEGFTFVRERGGFAFPRGAWVQLEQEIVLNQPGRRNGIVRVWQDGTLRFEKTDLVFRDSEVLAINGVLGEVVPVERDVAADTKDHKLWFSPFEVRWN